MPIYEYECKKCGKISEFIKSIKSSDKVEICPDCGGKAVRIVSQSSFILKGSGWYVTDYKRPKSSLKAQEKETPSEAPKGNKETGTATKDSAKVEKAS